MSGLSFAVSLMAAIVLAGCATEYGTQDLTGGYTEHQTAPDRWQLGFAGNGYTTQETVQTFWLYRAAELTLQQGYDGFEILSNITLLSFPAEPDGNAKLFNASAGGSSLLVPVYYKPTMWAEIRLLKKPFAGKPPRIFDAATLKAALEPYVKGKLCSGGNVCPHVHSYLKPPMDF